VTDDLVLHRGVAKGKCRSCKREVVFAEHASTGKLAPFEVDPAGEWTIENGVAKFVGKPPEQQLQLGLALDAKPAAEPATVVRYTSHFANCTRSEKWRR
jgi:hypothetical protein